MSLDAGNTKPKKSRAPKSPKSKAPDRIKCSLLLNRENDIRLTVLAAMKGTDRSSLINTILDDALRGVVVSLRGHLSGGAGDGTIGEPEAEAA